MSPMDTLRKRLNDAREVREKEMVHPKECKCKGHGTIPMSGFIIGYVRCE